MNPLSCSRRAWLKCLGSSVPAARMMQGGTQAGAASAKFTPVDLRQWRNCSPVDFGPQRETGGLVRPPAGAKELLGIPFQLGPAGTDEKSWVALSTAAKPWAARSVEIPIGRTAHYLCLAQFCDWDRNEQHPRDVDVIERAGQRLAEAVLLYEDGGTRRAAIRRRFEVNSPTSIWGHLSFGARPHGQASARKLSDPLPSGMGWGWLQSAVGGGSEGPLLWIWAWPNPEPGRRIRALSLEAGADDPLFVCGLTLFHEPGHPLRYERLGLYRFTLPDEGAEANRWNVSVDLGVVARTYMLPGFEPEKWLRETAGLGGPRRPLNSRYLYAEVTASPAATLTLLDSRTGSAYAFDLKDAASDREIAPRGSASVEVLERQKVWLHCQAIDGATGRPTPVRIAFRSGEGRYIPPYGHRTEINDAFFQDYGADLKVAGSAFAYVDGAFQVELPTGDVYVEMTKGFEYEAVRRKIEIRPGRRDLRLEIPRHTNLREQGWVTADTHVHFLSPSTAMLEAQAEGLNLINLLAAHWGDLFTNYGDLPHGPLTSADRETVVWPGTENRQHLLGHIGLLGGHGTPVSPLSAAGPGESYIGDPVWSSLADWADECRRRDGIAVSMHFPYPTGEVAADVVLGKLDAVEMHPREGIFDSLRFNDWYRYLNCGYRLPAVGGTDKMGADMPAGANRTYAWLGGEEFNFANWAKAVRRGNTFTTTGPLLLFQADGRRPGDEIVAGSGGGTVEARVEATGFAPFHRLEIVWNGRVVAAREEKSGTRKMTWTERVKIPGPGWLAARCASRLVLPTKAWTLAIAAHTSPVYVRVPGRDLFSPPAAAYFLALIEGAETWVRELATRPDPERFTRIQQVLAEARERLHARLHAHPADTSAR